MKRVGLVVWFTGAEARAHPLLDDPDDALELEERLSAFCKAIIADPAISSCLAGLHEHLAGTCARRADGQ